MEWNTEHIYSYMKTTKRYWLNIKEYELKNEYIHLT